MKKIGITRRLDELGRIVIPKEVRRTLNMAEGDALEIFTGNKNEVIFKKYSPVCGMGDLAERFAHVLHKASGQPVIICDRDEVVAAAGIPEREILKLPASYALRQRISNRQSVLFHEKVSPVTGSDYLALYGAPLESKSEACGYIMLVTENPDAQAGEMETKLTQMIAELIGYELEK